MRGTTLGAGALAVLLLAGVAGYLYLQREHLLAQAIETYGSEILGVEVRVDGVSFSPADGEGTVRGLRIGKPRGFDHEVAQVGAVELIVDPRTLADQTVRVRRIAVEAPRIAYEQGGHGTNFDALRRNVSRVLGETSTAERKSSTKLIVDRLVIRGAQLTYVPLGGVSTASMSLRLPDIVLTDIGKRRGGVTPAELSKLVVDTLIARTAAAVGRRAFDETVGRLIGR